VQTYIMRRVVLSLPTLFGVSVVVFVLLRLMRATSSHSWPVTSARERRDAAAILAEFRLDQNIAQQYVGGWRRRSRTSGRR